MIKKVIIITILLLLNSCTSSNYLIGMNTPNIIHTKNIKKSIGISQIDIPEYLLSRKLAISKGSKIEYKSDALWIGEIDKRLQKEIINYIQDRLPLSNIVEYPWSISKLPDINIKIIITKFISNGKEVELKSTYKIYNKRLDKQTIYHFNIKVKHQKDNEAVVKAMGMAFNKLSYDIYNKIIM